MHLIECDVADDGGAQRRNPDDIVPRARSYVALQVGDDVHRLTVYGEMGVRPYLRGRDVGRNGIGTEARADLGNRGRAVTFDVLDITGARVDRGAGKALEQHRGAKVVIEVGMRDENGLETPALRGDAIGQLLRVGD